MKRHFFLLACLALMAGTSIANDSEYYAVGNQLVPLKQTTIRVTKEILSIDLQDDRTALVDVYYEFTNPSSESKTILMGFEAAPPYPDAFAVSNTMAHPYIKNFKVEVNGQKIKYKNAISKTDNFNPMNVKGYSLEMGALIKDDDGQYIQDFAFVYYFDVTFKPGVNKIHHTYSYEMGGSTTYFYFLDYKLSPATRWANHQIDDFTLLINAKHTAKHFYIGVADAQNIKPEVISGKGKFRRSQSETYSEKDQPWEISLRNGTIRFHINNFRPTEELWIHSGTLCGGLSATYDRSIFMGDCGWIEHTDFDLRVMRNLPYANRGHIFKDPKLKKFFESCWWYMPDPKYKDETKDFTPYDWEYINFKPSKGQAY